MSNNHLKQKTEKRRKRKFSIRKTIAGRADRPRVTIHRSNKKLYLQAIDDQAKITLASAVSEGKNIESAIKLGTEFGKILDKQGIKMAVFDRNGYKYHGRVKAACDAIRESKVQI